MIAAAMIIAPTIIAEGLLMLEVLHDVPKAAKGALFKLVHYRKVLQLSGDMP